MGRREPDTLNPEGLSHLSSQALVALAVSVVPSDLDRCTLVTEFVVRILIALLATSNFRHHQLCFPQILPSSFLYVNITFLANEAIVDQFLLKGPLIKTTLLGR